MEGIVQGPPCLLKYTASLAQRTHTKSFTNIGQIVRQNNNTSKGRCFTAGARSGGMIIKASVQMHYPPCPGAAGVPQNSDRNHFLFLVFFFFYDSFTVCPYQTSATLIHDLTILCPLHPVYNSSTF